MARDIVKILVAILELVLLLGGMIIFIRGCFNKDVFECLIGMYVELNIQMRLLIKKDDD